MFFSPTQEFNNFDEEWKEFQRTLNSKEVKERAIREALRAKAKAQILIKKINELLEAETITKADSINGLINILKNEEPSQIYNIVNINLEYFLTENIIQLNTPIEEVLQILQSIIKEKEDFLNNFK